MSDELITLRKSLLNDRLREAWDDGFSEGAAAERGDEYSENPYQLRRSCGFTRCERDAEPGRRVCLQHLRFIIELASPRAES